VILQLIDELRLQLGFAVHVLGGDSRLVRRVLGAAPAPPPDSSPAWVTVVVAVIALIGFVVVALVVYIGAALAVALAPGDDKRRERAHKILRDLLGALRTCLDLLPQMVRGRGRGSGSGRGAGGSGGGAGRR
jgi:uncharacterized membrane protein YgcG